MRAELGCSYIVGAAAGRYAVCCGTAMQEPRGPMGQRTVFLPINALGFRDIPRDRTNYASALINLAHNFGGSVGICNKRRC